MCLTNGIFYERFKELVTIGEIGFLTVVGDKDISEF
jgi:hypothetical protein